MELAEDDIDELVEFWTLLDEDRKLLGSKRGATALGFALLLKHYSRFGRFPRGRSDLSDAVVGFVARQVGVDASELGFYELGSHLPETLEGRQEGELLDPPGRQGAADCQWPRRRPPSDREQRRP